MRAAIASLVTLAIASGSLAAQRPPVRPPRLLIPGAPFDAGDSLIPARGWFGLYRIPSGTYELRRADVHVEHGEFTCQQSRITTTDSAPPVLLVRGIPGLHVGPIDTVFAGHRFLYPGESVSWRLRQRWYALRAIGAAAETESSVLFHPYELRFGTSENQYASPQTLVRLDFTADNTLQLVWAGDLDGDGRLDLLLRIPGGGYGGDFRLYVSSLASSPALVAEAGRFFVADC